MICVIHVHHHSVKSEAAVLSIADNDVTVAGWSVIGFRETGRTSEWSGTSPSRRHCPSWSPTGTQRTLGGSVAIVLPFRTWSSVPRPQISRRMYRYPPNALLVQHPSGNSRSGPSDLWCRSLTDVSAIRNDEQDRADSRVIAWLVLYVSRRDRGVQFFEQH